MTAQTKILLMTELKELLAKNEWLAKSLRESASLGSELGVGEKALSFLEAYSLLVKGLLRKAENSEVR